MQRLLLICFLVVAFVSCQKEIQHPRKLDYPELKQNLKDSLSITDYFALDFSRVSRSVIKEVTLIRVAFKEKNMSESFLLVDVDANGKIKRGRIVQLIRDNEIEKFNGRLVVKNLKGEIIEETPIATGYRRNIKAMSRTSVVQPDPYVALPEVVVVASYPSSGGISWINWYNLLSFFNGGGNFYDSWYSMGDPFSGGGGSGGTSGGSPGDGTTELPPPDPDPNTPIGITDDQMMDVGFESQYGNPAIDLDKYINCFNSIPDAGAVCVITIMTDVPVNSDPTKIFDWTTGAPGHTWLRFEKSNGSQSASQHIGFYPVSGWKTTLTDAPIEGKYVDNQHHEFNASFRMELTPEKLTQALIRMQQLRNLKYDIDDYNCTDWALAVFNDVVPVDRRLSIPKFHVPGSLSPMGTSTPQGVYVTLKDRLTAGGSNAGGIEVPLVGWSGASTGPCN